VRPHARLPPVFDGVAATRDFPTHRVGPRSRSRKTDDRILTDGRARLLATKPERPALVPLRSNPEYESTASKIGNFNPTGRGWPGGFQESVS